MATKQKDYTVQASIGIVVVVLLGLIISIRQNNIAQERKDAAIAAAMPTPTATPTTEPTATPASTRTYDRSYRSRRSRRR